MNLFSSIGINLACYVCCSEDVLISSNDHNKWKELFNSVNLQILLYYVVEAK